MHARPIGATTVIRIGRYYLSHALAVFDNVMSADPTVDDAPYLLDRITRNA